MLPVEILALVISVALAGVAAGAAITLLVSVRKNNSTELNIRRADAYAAWLAARVTLTRASASFVAAFRTLAAEEPDSKYFALRHDEAQRARATWCEAVRELDQAEATLVAWSDQASIQSKLKQFEPVSAEALRAAVNGEQKEVGSLLQRLHHADQAATAFVRAATAGANPRPSIARKLVRHVAAYTESIVDHWGVR